MNDPQQFNLNCPLPLDLHTTVQLAHGGGGRLMRGLVEGLFLPAFAGTATGQPARQPPHDSAVDGSRRIRLAMTTDSFVISPLFFPGGDIGKLAVCGTVNDLAMAGAKPLWLSAAFILEEGFRWRRWAASSPRCSRPPKPRACGSSPATPKSSTAARATASSSTPRASASSRRGSTARRPGSLTATRSW